MAVKGHLDFCCLQETRWRGEGTRKMGAYKLFWMGCEKGIHGVGMLVADRWIEKVLDVKRVSERLMVVRVIVDRSVLNLISVYAPQAGWSREVKEEFLAMLGEVDHSISVACDHNWGATGISPRTTPVCPIHSRCTPDHW